MADTILIVITWLSPFMRGVSLRAARQVKSWSLDAILLQNGA